MKESPHCPYKKGDPPSGPEKSTPYLPWGERITWSYYHPALQAEENSRFQVQIQDDTHVSNM